MTQNLITLILSLLDSFFMASFFPTAIVFIFFGIDDFLIDAIAGVNRLGPRKLSTEEYQYIYQIPEKRLAILIASWKEGGILRNMIRGNLGLIQYKNVSFFLGVYPNDLETIKDADLLQSEFESVHKITNAVNGPTTKGQMINHLIREISKFEKYNKIEFDAFIIHDSEDIINPHAFKIMNWKLSNHDFVQVPVFSLPLSWRSLVAGTYVDEFSEAHTKDMLVRNHLGAPLPSAGVGTAVSRKLVNGICLAQGGELLNSDSLTEDYELGLSTQRFGAKSNFACYFLSKPSGSEFIATREYFPKSFLRSIRQKTRWTLGIAFQGWEHLGWKGSLSHVYFLYRDRKGPFCNVITGFALLLFLYYLTRNQYNPSLTLNIDSKGFFSILLWVNFFLMLNRVFQRMRSVFWVYGIKMAITVPIRFPVANTINAIAAFKAIYQYFKIRYFNVKPVWVKTEHELPTRFGIIPSTEQSSKLMSDLNATRRP